MSLTSGQRHRARPARGDRRPPARPASSHRDPSSEALRAYDELHARVTDIEALAHAANEVELPWAGDRERRRDLGQLGYG